MGFFDPIKDGWTLLKESFRLLFKKPIFLFPIFISWIIFVSIILYSRYYLSLPDNFGTAIGVFFLLIFMITFSICLANIVMLELMQQIESGKKISLKKALKEAFILDLLKMIPIAVIWAFIWMITLLIRALKSRSKGNSNAEPSAEDAARTLGGANSGPFSWLKLGLSMFEKLVRMIIFLTLPAIAWENKGPFSSFGQAFKIIKKHPGQFLTSYSLTGIAAFFMALPIIPIFWMSDAGVEISTTIWIIVIIYECITWTLGIYLEQMSVGLLYLWHMKWVKNGAKGRLSSVKKPDLLDNVYELR